MGVSIWMEFGRRGRPMQNDMLMMINRSKSKPEVEFQYGYRCFRKPEVVLCQPYVEVFQPNLVCKQISTFSNKCSQYSRTGSKYLPCCCM